MKVLVEVLAVILLAVPVALLIIFNAPGLGLILAVIVVAFAFYVKTQKANARGNMRGM